MGPIEVYYLGKKDDDFVTQIKHGPRFKKFQKTMNYYFKDCPDLVAKVNEKYFGNEVKSVGDITRYYNQKCH